jgi:hypothetical protein
MMSSRETRNQSRTAHTSHKAQAGRQLHMPAFTGSPDDDHLELRLDFSSKHTARVQLSGARMKNTVLYSLFMILVSGSCLAAAEQGTFKTNIQPLVQKYCQRCHNVDKMTSGIRVDQLDGLLEDRHLFLWKDILKQVADEAMPPEDEPQPTAQERKLLVDWIKQALITARSRNTAKNGSVRRLTVAQYRNTLRDLLGLEDNVADILPADGVSKDGFLNNGQTMELSPLLIEAYFEVAENALDRCIVDESSKPSIQKFRMDLGAGINAEPFPQPLILGALNHLLPNQDFMVTQLTAQKPFDFDPFFMRTKYRFNEGYQGNSTVRGWRDYDSIYHSVFACMRGKPGYPKGLAYQTVPEGLLLRPSVPSAELFQVESTYGPQANFKISLRELPDHGRFRVTVKAAKYNDGQLLDPGTESAANAAAENSLTVRDLASTQTLQVKEAGIYQADVYLEAPSGETVPPDSSKLTDELVGAWPLNGSAQARSERKELTGRLEGDAKFVDSPFGQAISLDGDGDSVVIPRDESMNVGEGEFTIAAWIRPHELRQGGIFCLGKYSWTHGWYFDMPNNQGVLRIETVSPANQSNGTVASRPGIIRKNKWQHVAAVVRRGENKTELFVNGYRVAAGSVAPTNLDNPNINLYIGRIQDAQQFKGEIDEIHFFGRALGMAEIQALIEPGRKFVQPPPPEKPKTLNLQIGESHFAGTLQQPAFLTVRLPAGPVPVIAKYGGAAIPHRVVFSRVDETSELGAKFATFEKRLPRLGVHVGLRRDCGSTLTQVGNAQLVTGNELASYIFEGAISNFPSPDVQEDNDNYLAGVREIGIRSEYTDGRDMPRLLIRSVEFEGPFYETWPPDTHRRIFVESNHKDDKPAYAREVIRNFATRAFRRPVSDAEAASLFAVFDSSFSETNDFTNSVKDALLVTLTSPQFLFLTENSATPEGEILDGPELASKLSYFLWNAAPDSRLRSLAETGKLHESIDTQVERMILDPKFEQFTREFVSQWLQLDKFEVVEIDRNRYPKLTRDTKRQLRNEPVQLVQYLMRENRPLRDLVQADFIVANEVVASYYDLGDRTERGFDFVAIPHDRKNLGGVLTNAGILAGLSDGRESNPVKRGAWLARKIIAEPPDDPPPNVPALPEENSNLTLRQKLEQHRNQEGCAKCHKGIDPWGIPFEQFDAGGLFKQAEPVDASSTLPDETEIADLNALKTYLAEDRIDQVAFSFLKHLTSYAIGRSLTYNEIEFLKEHGVGLRPDGYRMQEMIRFVVNSKMFLEK